MEAPRMLTASEIKLLRQAKREIAKRVNELWRLNREHYNQTFRVSDGEDLSYKA